MPDTPADPGLDPTRTPKLDPGPRKNLGKPPEMPNWQSILWYIPLMLLMLWVWQDQLHQMSVKTIPYSQFKQYLAAGEVAECEVRDLEITGRIVPKEARSQANTPPEGRSDESKPVTSPDKPSHPTASGRSSAIPAVAKSGESKPAVSPSKVTHPTGSGKSPSGSADKVGVCHNGGFLEGEGRKGEGQNDKK